MNDLIALIKELTEDSLYISRFIDVNIELLKDGDIDKMNKETAKFYSFMNASKARISKFEELMDKNNLKSIREINNSEKYNTDELKKILKDFEITLKDSQNKISMYEKIMSADLNMINKIKYFNKSGRVDFKI